MPSFDHSTRDRVIAYLETKSPASPKEIAEAIGWPDDQQATLRQMLGRMMASGILVKEGFGKYRLSPSYKERARPVAERLVDRVIHAVEGEGGIASKPDILLKVAGHRKCSSTFVPYVQVTKTLTR